MIEALASIEENRTSNARSFEDEPRRFYFESAAFGRRMDDEYRTTNSPRFRAFFGKRCEGKKINWRVWNGVRPGVFNLFVPQMGARRPSRTC